MNFIKIFILICFISFSGKVFSQTAATNTDCSNPTPFCTGQTMSFPAVTGTLTAPPAPTPTTTTSNPNYGCLGSQPRPSWFFMQINTAGPIVIAIAGSFDVDYICYGPFPNLTGACNNLTGPNQVDCSYSGSATETCTIPNAVPGQFYLLLITNFNGSAQNISFNQTNSGAVGAGSTNCGLVCIVSATNSGIICAGQTATLSMAPGTSSSVNTFSWAGPNGFSSTFSNNIISNVQSTSTYTLFGSASSTINNVPTTSTCQAVTTISVVQYPSYSITPSAPTICQGGRFFSVVTFTGSSVPGPVTYAWGPTAGSGLIWSPAAQSTSIIPLLQPATVTLATIVYSVTVAPAALYCPVTHTLKVTINNPLTPLLTMPAPVCDNHVPVQLTASPGGGTWTAANNVVTPSGIFNPANAVIGKNPLSYAVSVGTCVVSNVDTLKISHYYSPALSSSISTMCVQDPSYNLMTIVQNTNNGGWSGPQVSSAKFFNPAGLSTGNYNLKYKLYSSPDSLVCPDSTYLLVPVFNPPIPVINTIAARCTNASTLALSANPAGGIWSGSSGVSPSGIQTPSACIIGANTVSYTAGQGTCVASSSRTFHVSQFNTAHLTGSVPNLCVSNAAVNLMSIVQNTNGAWNGLHVNASNYFSPAGLPTNSYTAVYITTSTPTPWLCQDSSRITLSVLNPPTPTITQMGPFCSTASTVQLVVSPTTGSWVATSYLSSAGIFSPAISPVGSNMVQYIIGTNTCNTQQTKYIHTEAFVSAAIPGKIDDQCNTALAVNLTPLTLNNLGYWSGPGISGTIFSPSAVSAGKFILSYHTASSPSGLCPDQGTVAVQVFSLAIPSITTLGPICNNAATRQLQVSPVGGLFGGGLSGAVSASGLFNPALASIGNNIISYSISVGPCLAYAQTSISVERFVPADFEKIPEAAYCKNQVAFDLNSLVQNPGGLWSGSPGISGSMFDPSKANIGDNTIVHQTNSWPSTLLCPDTKSITIKVKNIPFVQASADRYFGCAPLEILLNTPSVNSGSGLWSFGDGSEQMIGLKGISHIYTSPGTYTVQFNYTDAEAKGCSATATLPRFISVYAMPKADFSYSPDEVTIAEPEITITNLSSSLSDNKYQWTIQGTDQEIYDVNPKVSFTQVGSYKITLSATSIDGCKSEISQIVEVKNDFTIFIPNSFTPNADGLNDVFKPVFSPFGLDVRTYQMEVFDRWGHSLFSTKDYTKGWDGTISNNGENSLKEDSYIYKIRYKDLDGRIYDKTGVLSLLVKQN